MNTVALKKGFLPLFMKHEREIQNHARLIISRAAVYNKLLCTHVISIAVANIIIF